MAVEVVAHIAVAVVVPTDSAVDTAVTRALGLGMATVVPVLYMVTEDKETAAGVLVVEEEAAYCNPAAPAVGMATMHRSWVAADTVIAEAPANLGVVA